MANYLISSTTINQMKEQISKITQNRILEIFDANITDLNELITEISYSSLFATERLIQIKNAEYFTTQKNSTNDLTILEKYLNNPNPLVTLIFTTNNKVDERKKVTKIIKEQGGLIICPVLTIKEICKIIEQDFIQAGYKINQECLYYIVNNSQNNYDLVLNQCDKIKLYYQEPTTITISVLKNIISSPLENNNFKLIEAIVNRDIKTAFKIYNDLKIQKVEPIIILNLLAREYRLLYLTKIMQKKLLTPFEIAKKLNLQTWQVERLINNSTNFRLSELKSILYELINYDLAIKSGQINKHLALEVFILKNA